MDWLESLKDVWQGENLTNWNKIYYLGSCQQIPESELDKIIGQNQLSDLLIQDEKEGNFDYFDFFLAENATDRQIVVVLSPFDLWEDERLIKTYSAIQENFTDLPDSELIQNLD